MKKDQRGINPASKPSEDWFYDYEKQGMVTIKGVELLPPHSHPEVQPSPRSLPVPQTSCASPHDAFNGSPLSFEDECLHAVIACSRCASRSETQ